MDFFCRSKQDFFIKFNPNINNYFGNDKSSIIVDRLEYWFSKCENSFYKFLEPCDHALYRVGDSWLEETGIKRHTFKRVFKLFGTWYNSKSEFLKQDDPFNGKLYSAYYDRKLNRTFFVRNNELVSSFFKNLKKNFFNKNHSAEKQKISSRVGENVNLNARSRIEQNARSFPRVDNIYNKLNNNYNNIINKQIITSSNNIDCTDLESEQQKILATKLNKEKDYKIIDKLKTIWLEEVGAFNDVGKSKYIAKQLLFTYNNHFESNISLFRTYCRTISSSKFLMGEVTSFKGRIDWLLQTSTIERIERKEFSLEDRVTNYEQRQQKQQLDSREREEDQTKLELEAQAKQGNTAQRTEAKLKLFIISKFGYAAYKSWFKEANISIDSKTNIAITGKTAFATEYINNNYVDIIRRAVSHL